MLPPPRPPPRHCRLPPPRRFGRCPTQGALRLPPLTEAYDARPDPCLSPVSPTPPPGLRTALPLVAQHLPAGTGPTASPSSSSSSSVSEALGLSYTGLASAQTTCTSSQLHRCPCLQLLPPAQSLYLCHSCFPPNKLHCAPRTTHTQDPPTRPWDRSTGCWLIPASVPFRAAALMRACGHLCQKERRRILPIFPNL